MATNASADAGERADWRSLSDDEVVRLVLAGDEALFEALMRRYNQRLFRVARAIVKDDAEAEDVMQHAYVQAYAHLAQFEGRARFSTWLTRIALYEALARVRRSRRTPGGPDPEDALRSPGPSPEEQAAHAEARALLESTIEGLPPAYRAVFVLRDVEGMDTAETAECLEVSADVVKTRLHRARALLREALLRRAGVATASAFSFHLVRCDRVVAAVLARLSFRPPRVH
jgi:RNA polymerase sigma-70 factor (ECF subfamily)